jgi:resuscitation-promoting factor RpfA
MDKSPDAFRTISEVADVLDTPAHVLRFWETRFPQIKPVKRAGGRRYYRPTDVALLTGIKRLLHDDGLTIRGVQKILREQGVRHVAALADGDGGEFNKQLEPYDIVHDTSAEEDDARPLVAAERGTARRGSLWPDADLPPPDDDGTLVLQFQVLDTEGLAMPAESDPAPADVVALAETQMPRDLFDAAQPGDAIAAPDDAVIAAVLQTAADPAPAPPHRIVDGWRSLPLAAGEDMPMAARLRALPRGALIPRSVEVAAWTVRARGLVARMRQAGPDGTGGSPSH